MESQQRREKSSLDQRMSGLEAMENSPSQYEFDIRDDSSEELKNNSDEGLSPNASDALRYFEDNENFKQQRWRDSSTNDFGVREEHDMPESSQPIYADKYYESPISLSPNDIPPREHERVRERREKQAIYEDRTTAGPSRRGPRRHRWKSGEVSYDDGRTQLGSISEFRQNNAQHTDQDSSTRGSYVKRWESDGRQRRLRGYNSAGSVRLGELTSRPGSPYYFNTRAERFRPAGFSYRDRERYVDKPHENRKRRKAPPKSDVLEYLRQTSRALSSDSYSSSSETDRATQPSSSPETPRRFQNPTRSKVFTLGLVVVI
ncbi:hypothetical protein HYFRA_00003590 [Hymenoscyphus fraxineus]|uniref:Uncharacterized protein n=1 Tax=Hymenoscyphus fraxineus TaxID=746836 RepID=A0A9N9PUH7_9HELO|nr:hypothetical protein HYFRA_00003590 [Hymenoscyphus fraxineus]